MKHRTVAGMARLDRTGGRQHPVPVEDRDVLGLSGVGMPAEQVVMMLADLAGLVVMPDVVEIGLGPGRVDETKDQQADPQGSGSMMMVRPPSHRFA